MRCDILRLNAVDAQAESVAGKVAGAAGASISSPALEEHVLATFIDRTIGVVGGDNAGGIEEGEQIGDNGGGSGCGERQAPAHQQPFSSMQDPIKETKTWPHWASCPRLGSICSRTLILP